MKLVERLDEIDGSMQGGAITIGNFDGVHRGHARLIERLRHLAEQVHGPAVVFTFDPHPARLLRPDCVPPPLTWLQRKAELLGSLGIDALVAYPTDTSLLQLTAETFFDKVVMQTLQAKAVVEGPNFYFGRDRAGDIRTLGSLCQSNNIYLEIVDATQELGELVSSSRIRKLLHDGDVSGAANLLGRAYRIRGMVTHGARRGSKIGFPTANLEAIDTLVPAQGVYAARAHFDSRSYAAAVNIGPNPTFGESAYKVEVHILDFDQSIYGNPLSVDFVERLRDIRPFAGVDELTKQLAHDVAQTRDVVNQ